jgi:hypothetical protein
VLLFFLNADINVTGKVSQWFGGPNKFLTGRIVLIPGQAHLALLVTILFRVTPTSDTTPLWRAIDVHGSEGNI